MQQKYQNITISGLPGCGSTTLLGLLKEELSQDQWVAFSGGEFMRAYAIEKGLFNPAQTTHHSAAVYNDDFDRQVDYGIREKVSTQSKWIIESWLSGFMAQNVPGTLKVLMICSDDAVRVDRIVNRDGVDRPLCEKVEPGRQHGSAGARGAGADRCGCAFHQRVIQSLTIWSTSVN